MKKPGSGQTQVKPMPNCWAADEWKLDYPNLFSFLNDERWDDGTIRIKGSISLFVQVGVLKLCLNDKAMERVTFVEAPTMGELFIRAESAVCDDSTDWKAQAKKIPY